MANPENKQIPYESTQKDIRDAIESVATAIGGIAIPSADHVSYDNSVSGLSATDVQNALDEIVSDIPTVNNGTLTIQQNGTSKGSFTANSASNVNVNIETPTTDKKTATDQFTTADGGLLSKCMIDLVPVQSGSGDPSPDNVRPISGHTEVDLQVDGKNLLNPTNAFGSFSGYTINTDGSVTVTEADGRTWNNIAPIPLKAGTYTLSRDVTVGRTAVRTSDNNYGSDIIIFEGRTSISFTLAQDGGIKVKANYSGTYPITIKFQLEQGNQATPYEPYLGHLYQVQIGSTVYGGYVDLVSGEMTITHGYLDASSITWAPQTNSRWFYNGLTAVIKIPPDTSTPTETISDRFVAMSNVDMAGTTNIGLSVNGSGSLVIRNGSTTIQPEGQVVYPLATPTTIQLTPQQIEALVGQNNLSTPLSGQSIETNGVEYKELFTFADVKEYVDKKIPDAPTTDGTYTLQAVVSSGVPTYSWV